MITGSAHIYLYGEMWKPNTNNIPKIIFAKFCIDRENKEGTNRFNMSKKCRCIIFWKFHSTCFYRT